MRRRRIDCAIATATPLSDGDSLRCDVLCVCVFVRDWRWRRSCWFCSAAASMSHGHQRNTDRARERLAIFSSTKTRKNQHFRESVCVCEWLYYRAWRKTFVEQIFRSWCESGQKQQRRQCRVFPATNLCGNLSPANWTFDLAAVLGRTWAHNTTVSTGTEQANQSTASLQQAGGSAISDKLTLSHLLNMASLPPTSISSSSIYDKWCCCGERKESRRQNSDCPSFGCFPLPWRWW